LWWISVTCVAIITRDVVDTTRQPNIGSKIWVPRRFPAVFISMYFLRFFPEDSAIGRRPCGFSRCLAAAEVAITTRTVAALVDVPSGYHHVGLNYDPSMLIYPDYPLYNLPNPVFCKCNSVPIYTARKHCV